MAEAAPIVLRVLGGRTETHRVEQFPFHIGRGSGCDLVLEDDLASRTHAVLLMESEGVVLVDDHSSNGTWVNDRLVTRQKLDQGDVIRIGTSRIAVAEVATTRRCQSTADIVLTRRVQQKDSSGSLSLPSAVPDLAQRQTGSGTDIAALSLVYRLADELGRISSKPGLWASAAAFIAEIVRSPSVAFLLEPLDPQGRSFRQVVRSPGDTEPLAANIVEEAVARRALVVSRDTHQASRRGSPPPLPRTILCAPFFQDRDLRLVCYLTQRKASFAEMEVDLLSTVCAQTYLAFERLDAVERLIGYGREIAQKERLATIGKLVAILAHETRTPLTVAQGEIELAQTEVPGPPQAARLERALCALDGVTKILGDTLAYARDVPGAMARVDVPRAVESALRLIEPELQERCSLVRRFVPSPAVLGEEVRLGQVVLNLVRNAFEAFDPRRREANRLVVEVRPGSNDETHLVVSDNGPGIAPEHLPRIFEAFFTTRGSSFGTGLGLAICRDIVRGMHGSIAVAPTSGGGTTFTVALPGWTSGTIAAISDKTHT